MLNYKKNKMRAIKFSDHAHQYLKKHFGNRYIQKARDIANQWTLIDQKFNTKETYHDRNAIMAWLGSQGFCVDKCLAKEDTDFVIDAVTKQLQEFAQKKVKGKPLFTITESKEFKHEALVVSTLTIQIIHPSWER